MENNKIDFVITWVDGNDSNWQREKQKYEAEAKNYCDSRNIRYRDWDNLKYWFRGIEKFTPWVNKIHFVTNGQVPKWLNVNHPKLNLVKHEDFMPKEYLPTFNSIAIENNLHRIKDLSDNFVFFNDDMFIIKNMKEKDFFNKGLPCDIAILNSHISRREIGNHIEAANMDVINAHFKKEESIKNNLFKWINFKYGIDVFRTFCLLPWNSFVGIYNQHLPNSYQKSTYEELWKLEYNVLDTACKHKFRYALDVSQWLFQDWQIASGKFYPRKKNTGRSFDLKNEEINNKEVYKCITNQKYKMICVNDWVNTDNFESVKKELNSAFDTILPDRSEFELGE